MTREQMQTEAKASAIASLDEIGRALLQMGTGSGKTKTTLDILAYYNPEKITWLTNSTDLRDDTTPAEFIKWGYEDLLERTTFICYQSAYKLEDKDLGFVVADEADYSLTVEYNKVYHNNRYDKLLMVTATIKDDQMTLLGNIAPIVYRFSTQDAQDAGILNQTKFVFVKYMLSTEKNIKVETKTKSWLTSEQEQYTYLDNQYTSVLLQFLDAKNKIDAYYNSFESTTTSTEIPGLIKKKNEAARKMKWINAQRFNMLSGLHSSRVVTKKLLRKLYDASEENKILVFSNRVEQIEKIITNTYHSKNKGTKAQPNTSLLDFNEGRLRAMGVCQAINRGVNMVGLKFSIFESYDGSSVKGQQRVGRMCRLLADQEATIYILQPYYLKKYKIKDEEGRVGFSMKEAPTRAVAWSENMLSDFRLDNAEYINANEI